MSNISIFLGNGASTLFWKDKWFGDNTSLEEWYPGQPHILLLNPCHWLTPLHVEEDGGEPLEMSHGRDVGVKGVPWDESL
ncbi:MAG: hypothetical protein Q8877_02760 [Sweet potato little leaf phytoplasma]|nr:hypothetical protein [Sweet potato little leaf phytoplasma]